MNRTAYTLIFILLTTLLLPGCGLQQAARAKIEYSDLKINVEDPYPVTVDARDGDGIYLRIADRTGIDLEQPVKTAVEQRLSGKFKLAKSEDEARFIVRVDMNDKLEEKSAREVIGGASDGGAVAGAGIGASAGLANGSLGQAVVGAAAGMVIGGISDLASSMVKVGEARVYCTVSVKQRLPQTVKTELKTRIQEGNSVEEQTIDEESNFKKKSCKFTVFAKKVGLTPDEARDPLSQAIAKEAAGIF